MSTTAKGGTLGAPTTANVVSSHVQVSGVLICGRSRAPGAWPLARPHPLTRLSRPGALPIPPIECGRGGSERPGRPGGVVRVCGTDGKRWPKRKRAPQMNGALPASLFCILPP